jgi:hypothetical protein
MIRRSARKQTWTTIDNEVINDVRLTWEARGLLIFLLSKPDRWEIRKEHLIASSPSGETVVRRILKELTQYHYMKRVRYKGENGRFYYITEIFDNPQENEECSDCAGEDAQRLGEDAQPWLGDEAPSDDEILESPYVGNPHAESPHADHPENPTIYKERSSKDSGERTNKEKTNERTRASEDVDHGETLLPRSSSFSDSDFSGKLTSAKDIPAAHYEEFIAECLQRFPHFVEPLESIPASVTSRVPYKVGMLINWLRGVGTPPETPPTPSQPRPQASATYVPNQNVPSEIREAFYAAKNKVNTRDSESVSRPRRPSAR